METATLIAVWLVAAVCAAGVMAIMIYATREWRNGR